MNIEQRTGRKITTLCSLLGYSRQAFYQWKEAAEQSALKEELIVQEVLRIRERQKRLGGKKLYVLLGNFLQEHNISIGRDAFLNVLSEYDLNIRKRKRKIPRTTFSDPLFRKYANLTIGLHPTGANQLWVSDITYISLSDGFAYLSLVTDAYSRMIVGYYLSKDLSAAGCVKALKMAMKQLSQGSSLIHHSDRGSQYCSMEYTEILYNSDISISMTQNSDPRENAIAERINGIIKQELLDTGYDSLALAVTGIKNAVDIYNNERPHSSLNMLPPVKAHAMTGELKKHWKNYYATKRKEVSMT
jgi:putative transposase